jgi:hypothetical protein
MTMTFGNRWFAIQLANDAIVGQLAGLCAKTHCATQIALLGTDFDVAFFVSPFSDKRHYRVLTVWHKFRRVRVFHPRYVARKFDQRNLHTQANAEVRNIVFTRIACGSDLAFDTTVAEAARDQNRIQIFQNFDATCFYILRVNQLDVYRDAVLQTTVFQRFGQNLMYFFTPFGNLM